MTDKGGLKRSELVVFATDTIKSKLSLMLEANLTERQRVKGEGILPNLKRTTNVNLEYGSHYNHIKPIK